MVEQWSDQRTRLEAQSLQLAKLKRNLALSGRVDHQVRQLGDQAVQNGTDEVTLARFLRRIETVSRDAGITLVNMKPLPVERCPTYKSYPVRLSVAGPIQKVLQFGNDLTHGPQITGTESFSVRAVRAANGVECTLSIWMVQLLADDPPPAEADAVRTTMMERTEDHAG